MAVETLSDFLSILEREGELARIRTAVSPVLELAEIAHRVMKMPAAHGHAERDRSPAGAAGGKALLFENVEGSDIPVAINVFGSYWRMCKALSTENLDALAGRVAQLIKPDIPTTFFEKVKKLPDLLRLSSYTPRTVRNGICQEVVYEGEQADLNRLPLITCWPLDGNIDSGQVADLAALGKGVRSLLPERPEGRCEKKASDPFSERGTGRYITLGQCFSRNPETGDRNIGMYRIQQYSARKAALHWHMHHDGARNWRLYQRRGEKMPIAIAFGAEPALTYAATAPLPPGVDETLFAGFIAGKGIELVKCRTIDLEVPANAEIVIEGFIDPKEDLLEGPFGDHTGYYSQADWYRALYVTAITTRKQPIYPATVVGRVPMEDYFLGKATERIFLPLLRMIIPDIIDYTLPASGVFHNCVYVKIRKDYPYQARRVMHAIWGAGQMSFTKFIIVVDEDVDIHDEQEVLFHLFANCDPARDSEIVRGPVDILDHASPAIGCGSKIGFDATVKIKGEGDIRPWPARLEMDAQTKELVTRKWTEYGL